MKEFINKIQSHYDSTERKQEGIAHINNSVDTFALRAGDGWKAAFTLAEVLITLAIVGIVAAITLPTLISKFDKKVASIHLKKFYSNYMQAKIMVLNDLNTTDGKDILLTPKNPEQMLAYYKKYFEPYLKTVEIEKTNVGIQATFADGSGMLIAKNGGAPGTMNTHVLYCVNKKYCEKHKNNEWLDALSDGKNTFLFYIYTAPQNIYEYTEDGVIVSGIEDRSEVLRLCKHNTRNCTSLLLIDNWEFKDDYPW